MTISSSGRQLHDLGPAVSSWRAVSERETIEVTQPGAPDGSGVVPQRPSFRSPCWSASADTFWRLRSSLVAKTHLDMAVVEDGVVLTVKLSRSGSGIGRFRKLLIP